MKLKEHQPRWNKFLRITVSADPLCKGYSFTILFSPPPLPPPPPHTDTHTHHTNTRLITVEHKINHKDIRATAINLSRREGCLGPVKHLFCSFYAKRLWLKAVNYFPKKA